MGFYPHVKKGDKVRPSASLENAKRDLVNRFQGIAKSGNKARITSVAVYNATDTKIAAYSAVKLVPDKVIREVIPVAATSAYGDQIFGIVLDSIEPGKVGYAAIDGIANANIMIHSNLHKYAVAGPGGKLETADSGPVMLCGRYDTENEQKICLVKLSSANGALKPVRAKIISGSAIEGYRAAIIDQKDAYGRSIEIRIHAVELAMNADIPAGTVVLAHLYQTLEQENEE